MALKKKSSFRIRGGGIFFVSITFLVGLIFLIMLFRKKKEHFQYWPRPNQWNKNTGNQFKSTAVDSASGSGTNKNSAKDLRTRAVDSMAGNTNKDSAKDLKGRIIDSVSGSGTNKNTGQQFKDKIVSNAAQTLNNALNPGTSMSREQVAAAAEQAKRDICANQEKRNAYNQSSMAKFFPLNC